MSGPDLGECESFVWELNRSTLVDRGRLDQLVGDYLKTQANPTPHDLACNLVERHILTPFQAECILSGKGQDLVFNPYVLTDAIGSGSMGTVFKALSKSDGQWYALKLVPRRSMWNVRIARRIVRSFESCTHPAIVPFVDVGTSGGAHFLTWKLVEGETLDHLVRRKGTLLPGVAALYALQTAEGLDACHQQNLFHGLLKPANLMITRAQQVLILDAGIGVLLAESGDESLVDTMSTANAVTSGLDCRSPENIIDPSLRTSAGDQYSLGCIIYFCLTGSFPFSEETMVQKMMAHQTQEPASIKQFCPQVPQALEAVVQRLMKKDPAERYRSIEEAVVALRPLAVRPEIAVKLIGELIMPGAPTASTNGQTSTPTKAAVQKAVPAKPVAPTTRRPVSATMPGVALPEAPRKKAAPTLHGIADPTRPKSSKATLPTAPKPQTPANDVDNSEQSKPFAQPMAAHVFHMSDLVDRSRPTPPPPLSLKVIISVGAACFVVGAVVVGGLVWWLTH